MSKIAQDGNMNIDFSLANEDGVTLIEVMVYMVMAGMLLAAAVMAFMGQNKTYNRQDIIAEIQQNIRSASQLMASEIRMAGFDPAEKGEVGFVSAAENVLSFDYWEDTNGNGSYDDETAPRSITYDLYDMYDDGSTDIRRTVGGQEMPLAENINRLRFEYMYRKGNAWFWAKDAAAIQAALSVSADKALEKIRAVKIIVLGHSRPSAFTVTDSTVYRPPLEGSATQDWTAAANSGDRRLLSVVVQCRNN